MVMFGNTKGGSGKSSILSTFANYLLLKGEGVVVVDIDSQAYLYGNRQEEIAEWQEAHPGADTPEPPYPIFFYRDFGNNEEEVIERLKKVPGWVLVDSPGNQVEDRLIPWWQASDHLVIPVNFDRGSRRTTKIYAETVRQITQVPITFMPNRIKFDHGKNAIQDADEKATKDLLKPYGRFTSRVKDGSVISRFSTIKMLPPHQLKEVADVFEALIKHVNKK